MELIIVIILIVLFARIAYQEDAISITFLFGFMILMLYVVPYLLLWKTFKELALVSERHLQSFLFYIFICFISFLIGTKLVKENKKKAFSHSFSTKYLFRNIHVVKFEIYTIFFGILGILFYSYFIVVSGGAYFSGHGQSNYKMGGYIYEMRYFVFSAVLLLFTLKLHGLSSKTGFLFMIFFSSFLLFDAYVQQQRGSLLRFASIFILPIIFNGYKKGKTHIPVLLLYKTNKKIILLGIFFAFALVFTVQVRKYYDINKSLFDVTSNTLKLILDEPELLIAGSGIDHGNEFVVAYNAFFAMEESGQLDYGYKWIYPWLNFFPRELWKDKPTWENFSTNAHTFIDKYSVIEHAVGSAETGLIDTFYRFGWYSPIFLFVVGYFSRYIFEKAKYDMKMRMLYTCLFIGFFYFFSQTMLPLVIFTVYMYIPIYLVYMLSSTKGSYGLAKI